MTLDSILVAIPVGLKKPLIDEYNSIIQNYLERKWTASELSGGKFCEIVYTILEGYASGAYAATPSKPSNMVDACKKLENHSVVRSFKILIPRMLPALYEIRNNRNVGHVGGDVDPNMMDAQAVVSMCSWILGEMIRVLHNTSIDDAQKIVDFVTVRKIPVVWNIGKVKRVLNTGLSLKEKVLLLIGSSTSPTSSNELFQWTEYSNKTYFMKLLNQLHKERLIELHPDKSAELLPPGILFVESTLKKISK